MARTDPQINVRLPVELKELLDSAAGEGARSLTAEVVDRLWKSFPTIETVMLQNRRAEIAMIHADVQKRSAILADIEGQLANPKLPTRERIALTAEAERHKEKVSWYRTLTGPIMDQAVALSQAAEAALDKQGAAISRGNIRRTRA